MVRDNTIKLHYSDSITSESVKSFIHNLQSAYNKNSDADNIIIYISSPGGDVELAIELYNFLRTLDCNITTINTSFVNSAAIIIYLAGDKRLAYNTSTFYVHSVCKKLRGNFDVKKLKPIIKELIVNSENIISLLSERAGKSKKYWNKTMAEGRIFKASEALHVKLCTALI